jgi:hypothetical protein
VLANFDPILIPIGLPQFLSKHFVVHNGRSHFFPFFDAPEDDTDEVQIVLRENFKVALVLTMLETIIEGNYCGTEIVFDRFA